MARAHVSVIEMGMLSALRKDLRKAAPWVLIAVVVCVVAAVVARRDSQTAHSEPIIKHLPWKDGLDMSARAYYGELKESIEKNGIRVERDGSEITISASAKFCHDAEPLFEKSIPREITVTCRSDRAEWVLDRK